MPVTMQLDSELVEPMVILELVVVHVPPPALLPSVVVPPMHTCSNPVIVDGVVLTVTV